MPSAALTLEAISKLSAAMPRLPIYEFHFHPSAYSYQTFSLLEAANKRKAGLPFGGSGFSDHLIPMVEDRDVPEGVVVRFEFDRRGPLRSIIGVQTVSLAQLA